MEAKLDVKLPPLLLVGKETLKAEFKGEISLPAFLPPVERERPPLKLVEIEQGLVDVVERPSPQPQSPGCAYRTAVGTSVAKVLQGVEATYKRALYLYLKGERNRARALFWRVAEGHPKTLYASMALYWLAEMALEDEDMTEGLDLLRRLRELQPYSPYGDYALEAEAWILLKEGQAEEALQVLEPIKERFPQSPLIPSARLMEAIIRAHLGQWEECLGIARSLEEVFPERAFYLEGLAAFSLGRYLEAQEALGRFLEAGKGHPLFGNGLCLMGLAKLNTGDLKGASLFFQDYLLLYPKGPWAGVARTALVRISLAEGEEEGARAHIETLRESISPWLTDALLEYAFFLYERARNDEALLCLEEILQGNPPSEARLKAQYLRGEILAVKGAFQEASRAFSEVSEGEGELAFYAALNQGLCLLHARKPSEAKGVLEFLQERLPPGHPLSDDLHFLLGRARLEGGDPEGALLAFQEIADQEVQRKASLSLALFYFNQGQWEKALQWAVKAGGGRGRFLEGLCLFNMRDYEGALRALEGLKGEDTDPNMVKEAFYYRGLAQYKLGRFQEATTTLGQFIRQYPTDPLIPMALYWKGWAFSRMGDWKEAEEAFLTLAENHPQHPLAPEAWLRVGDARYNRGLYEEAILAYLKVRTRYPHSESIPDALWGIVLSYYTSGFVDRFLFWADQLVRSYPQHPLAKRVMMLLGEYYETKGDLQGAEAHYRRVLEGFPEAEEARVPLGRVLGKEGKKGEALEVLGGVKREPYLWEAFLEMARLTLEDDPRRGSLYLWKLVEQSPEDFAAKAVLLGDSLPPEEERDLLLKFLSRFPSSPYASYFMIRLGEVALGTGKAEEAFEWFLKGAEASSEEAIKARCELKAAQALMAMGRNQQALEQALKVLYLYPQQQVEKALALLVAAQIYKAQGAVDKFGQACRRAKEISQAEEVVRKVREVCGGQTR